jgi:hypothetical protein
LPSNRIGNVVAKRQPERPVGTAGNGWFDDQRVDSKIGAGVIKRSGIKRAPDGSISKA